MNTSLIEILFSVIIEVILGLETETRSENIDEKSKLGGVRTYTILSLFGGISGILFINGLQIFSVLLFATLIGLVIVAYVWNVKLNLAFGITTEIAVVITFILGFLSTSRIIPIEAVLVITVVLLFFLSGKTGISSIVNKIKHQEVVDFIKFGIIALVILPFLPDQNIYVGDFLKYIGLETALEQTNILNSFFLLNPYSLWFTVVLISGFGLLGYTISKFIGAKRGMLATGFLTGFVSSTAAIVSFANRSKKNVGMHLPLAGGAMLSNASSFIVVIILVLITSKTLFENSLPFILALMLSSFIISLFYISSVKNNIKANDSEVEYEPFSIMPAVKLVFIILLVRIAVQFLQLINTDENLIIILTSFAGLVGIDAPIIAIAGLFSAGAITVDSAVFGIVLINLVNYFAKFVYSFIFGSRDYSKLILIGLGISGVVGVIVSFLV